MTRLKVYSSALYVLVFIGLLTVVVQHPEEQDMTPGLWGWLWIGWASLGLVGMAEWIIRDRGTR